MTFYQYINTNIDRIRSEIKMGLIPSAILHQWEIYSRYDTHRRTGAAVSEAVYCTSMDKRVSDRYVYYIIKQMETNV